MKMRKMKQIFTKIAKSENFFHFWNKRRKAEKAGKIYIYRENYNKNPIFFNKYIDNTYFL